jgi:hypothetical protein
MLIEIYFHNEFWHSNPIEGYFPIKFLLNDYENIITKLSKNQYKKYDKILLKTNYYDWLKIV